MTKWLPDSYCPLKKETKQWLTELLCEQWSKIHQETGFATCRSPSCISCSGFSAGESTRFVFVKLLQPFRGFNPFKQKFKNYLSNKGRLTPRAGSKNATALRLHPEALVEVVTVRPAAIIHTGTLSCSQMSCKPQQPEDGPIRSEKRISDTSEWTQSIEPAGSLHPLQSCLGSAQLRDVQKPHKLGFVLWNDPAPSAAPPSTLMSSVKPPNVIRGSEKKVT